MMTSGYGQYHTNEADLHKPTKELTPYLTIDMDGIRALVDHPQRVDKAKAQWLIPSTLPVRNFEQQRADGECSIMWTDFDTNPLPLKQLEVKVKEMLGDTANFELYTTSSATKNNPKSRLIIPLESHLTGFEFISCQQVLNDKFEALGITVDRSAEEPAQLCYLPNRGDYYEVLTKRDGIDVSPLQHWAVDLKAKNEVKDIARKAKDKAKLEALEKRNTLPLSDTPDLIEHFNRAYSCEEILEQAGYDRKGNVFRHPNSESGSYSASILNDRVHTLSTADLLHVDGSRSGHDAFSTFTVLFHSGNSDNALIDAGDNWLTIGGVSFNKAVQVAYAKKKKAEDEAREKPGGDKEKKSLDFKLVSANELMTREISHDWQVKGLFEHGNIGQIFGATGSGKSFVVLDMGYCIASGIDYICGEGFSGLSRRLHALQNKYEQDITNKFFISEQPAAFMDISVTSAVCEAVKAVGNVSLVVVDTYHRNMGGGNENSADDFGAVLRNIDTFLKPLGVTVLIIHHSGHEATGRSRGSSSIRAAMDFEYQTTLSSHGLILSNTKMKDATTPAPMLFDFVPVTLGEDEDGESITSAYLNASEVGEHGGGKKVRKKLNARDDAILQTLNDAITQCGIEPTDDIKAKFSGFDSITGKMQKIVLIDHWRELAYKSISVDSDEEGKAQAKKKAFKRCRGKLLDDGYTVEYGDYAWRIFESN
jgi:hypothetical protein